MILKRIDVPNDGQRYVFHCPGCNAEHSFAVGNKTGVDTWYFNGDLDRPTFNPSLIQLEGNVRCHLHVGGGRIRYLKESTHHLANHDVPMVELPRGDEPCTAA